MMDEKNVTYLLIFIIILSAGIMACFAEYIAGKPIEKIFFILWIILVYYTMITWK